MCDLIRWIGNNSEEDSDKEPEPPTKVADKPTARHGKRDAPKEAPSEPRAAAAGGDRGGRGGRRGGFTGSDQGMTKFSKATTRCDYRLSFVSDHG